MPIKEVNENELAKPEEEETKGGDTRDEEWDIDCRKYRGKVKSDNNNNENEDSEDDDEVDKGYDKRGEEDDDNKDNKVSGD